MSSWIRLDEAIFTDDWYMDLSEPCKIAWIHFLLLAKRNRGRVGTCSPKLLASNLHTSQNSAQEMIDSALKNGNLLLEDGKFWKVKNWAKYQEDQTNSERQTRHRSNGSNVEERYSPLRNGNNADGTKTRRDETGRDGTYPMTDADGPLHTSRAPEHTRESTAPTSATNVAGPPPNPDIGQTIAEALKHSNGTGPPKSEAATLCDELCQIVGARTKNDRTGIWVDCSSMAAQHGLEPVRRIIAEMREVMTTGEARNPIGLARRKLRGDPA